MQIYSEETMNSPVREAVERLKTNIKLYNFGTEIKTLTITSYRAEDGKSYVAQNLAKAMAESGMSVLLVDADMRKPELMKELKGKNFQGLSNYLMGKAKLEDIINTTSIDYFHHISCGIKPLNPVGLLSSSQFKELLGLAASQYDMVIFDTPPLGSVIDSMIVASQTDGAIFVIAPGKVNYKNFKMINNQFEKSNVKILGVVLNKIPMSEYKNYIKEYDYYGSKKKYSRDWLNKDDNYGSNEASC